MEPEVLIGILGVFISGGAIGAGGALLVQWINKKLLWRPPTPLTQEAPDVELLRGEIADLVRVVVNMNERLEFQERLISGGASAPPDGRRQPVAK